MKTIIHSVAALLILIACASAGAISKIQTDTTSATINANLTAGEEVRVFVGDDAIGWSAPTGVAKAMQIKVTGSDQVPLDDGTKGKGFIIQTPNTVHNVAIVKDGPIPLGQLVFRPSNLIIQKDGVWTFADIRQADGKLVPISAKVRSGGNW